MNRHIDERLNEEKIAADYMEMMKRHIGDQLTEERLSGGYVKFVKYKGRKYEVKELYVLSNDGGTDYVDDDDSAQIIVCLKRAGHGDEIMRGEDLSPIRLIRKDEQIAFRMDEMIGNPDFLESQFDEVEQ